MIEQKLQKLSSKKLRIVWHENKTTYLTVTRKRNEVYLRVHRLFYKAPSPVHEALVRYAVQKEEKSLAILKQMAHLHFSKHSIAPDPLATRGKAYDLKKIFTKLLTLVPLKDVTIGWSDRVRVGKFRSMTFGTFDKYTRQIRINPLLDDPDVPLYFLEFIVYHEMLHAVCQSQMDVHGRCTVHTKEFKERERQFPHFKRAQEWEKGALTFFKRKSRGRS